MVNKMPEPPENFAFNDSTGLLSWNPVIGALEYYIEASLESLELWTRVYDQGNNTSAQFNRPPGTYKVKGKTKDNSGWGNTGSPKIIIVPE